MKALSSRSGFLLVSTKKQQHCIVLFSSPLLSQTIKSVMLLFICTGFLTVSAGAQTDINVYIFDEIKTATLIGKLCESRWPSDFKLQNYCRQEQKQALNELHQAKSGLGVYDISGNEFEIIRNNCGRKWQPDFKLWAYCESQQREAVVAMRNRDPYEISPQEFKVIRNACSEKWRGDFVMQNACEVGTLQNVLKSRSR